MTINPEMLFVNRNQFIGNHTQTKNSQNLELTTSDVPPTHPGLKVEILSIPIPVSVYTEYNGFNDFKLQNKIYLKKKYSLISLSKLVISKTVNLSPLITKLQI